MATHALDIDHVNPYRRYRTWELHEKIGALAPRYFDGPGKVPRSNEDARSEIILAALTYVEKHPYNPNRLGRKSKKPATVNTYVKRVLDFCRQGYFKLEEQKKRRSLDGGHSGGDSEHACTVSDPFTRADSFGDPEISTVYFMLGGKVGTPPWEVRFTSPSEPKRYRTNPLYVPPFDLVPQDPDKGATMLTPKGRLVRVKTHDLSRSQLQELEKHAEELQAAIASMFREYLYSYGFRTLKPEQRAIVAKMNKEGLDLEKARRSLKLGNRDFKKRLEAMALRGWRIVMEPRPGSTRGQLEYRAKLVYHPACDGQKGAFERRLLEDIDLVPFHERLMLVDGDVDHLLTGEDWAARDVEKILGKAHGLLLEKGTELKGEQDYDDRFRDFIKRFVERPILTKGLDVASVESLIVNTPRERLAVLMERAISGRKSLADCMGLTEHFPEIQAKKEVPGPTLASLFAPKPLRRAA